MIEMQVGKRYVVMKESDDGTFHLGDNIALCADGAITCHEASGWIDPDNVEVAIKGMVIELDKAYYARRKEMLEKELGKIA